MFNLNPKQDDSRQMSDLDDLYMKIPHEFGHLFFVSSTRDSRYDTFSPYDNISEKVQFNKVFVKTLEGILADYKVATTNDKTEISDAFCSNYNSIISGIEYKMAIDSRSGRDIMDQMNKHQVISTLGKAICLYQSEEGEMPNLLLEVLSKLPMVLRAILV